MNYSTVNEDLTVANTLFLRFTSVEDSMAVELSGAPWPVESESAGLRRMNLIDSVRGSNIRLRRG